MVDIFKYSRVFTTESGASDIESVSVQFTMRDYAPPAPVLEVSATTSASSASFLRLARGWSGDWHPSPWRQWLFLLEGEIEFEVGSGKRLAASPGAVVLLEDTTGRGHRSRVVGQSAVVIAAVRADAPGSAPDAA